MTDPDQRPEASPEEIDYLCRAANRYLHTPIDGADVAWHFAGVRPLLDDGKETAAKSTREYSVIGDQPTPEDGPLLNIVSGKVTTYRGRAEKTMTRRAASDPQTGPEGARPR